MTSFPPVKLLLDKEEVGEEKYTQATHTQACHVTQELLYSWTGSCYRIRRSSSTLNVCLEACFARSFCVALFPPGFSGGGKVFPTCAAHLLSIRDLTFYDVATFGRRSAVSQMRILIGDPRL